MCARFITGGKRRISMSGARWREIRTLRPSTTRSKVAVRANTPSIPVERNSSSVVSFRGSRTTKFIGIYSSFSLVSPPACDAALIREQGRHLDEQRRSGDVRKDPVVVDHHRRGQRVAQEARDAELAVVAIAREPAGHRNDGECSVTRFLRE